MHFLVVPYALISVSFSLLYLGRDLPSARRTAIVSLAVFFVYLIAVLTSRDAIGDSFRYFVRFSYIRQLSLVEALQQFLFDPLFTLLLWFVGQVGSDAWVLFLSTILIYLAVVTLALNRLLPPITAALVLFAYIGYPYFVAYAVNALRQGLALAFIVMALVQLYRGSRLGWIWLVLAPLWHNGAWMASAVVGLHEMMVRFVPSDRAKWALVSAAFVLSLVLSITSYNGVLMQSLPDVFEISPTQYIYFTGSDRLDYRTGFRMDFFLLSILPLLTAFLLGYIRSRVFDYRSAGWWLSVYLSLNVIYNIFSFAPFADRFASFSWFILPLVVVIQASLVRSRRLEDIAVVSIALANVFAIQFYTGDFINPPA